MPMLRLLLLAVLALAPGFEAEAQVSPDDARWTLEVLQDPDKRAQLVTTLETIAKAGQTETPAPAAPATPAAVGGEVLAGASGFLNHTASQAIAAVGTVRSIPLLWVWLKGMATDPEARGILLDAAWRLVLIFDEGLVG
jgi:hypothetical protein